MRGSAVGLVILVGSFAALALLPAHDTPNAAVLSQVVTPTLAVTPTVTISPTVLVAVGTVAAEMPPQMGEADVCATQVAWWIARETAEPPAWRIRARAWLPLAVRSF